MKKNRLRARIIHACGICIQGIRRRTVLENTFVAETLCRFSSDMVNWINMGSEIFESHIALDSTTVSSGLAPSSVERATI